MKGNSQINERVLVHVRVRPFNEEENKNHNTSPIESLDTKNATIIGKIISNIY